MHIPDGYIGPVTYGSLWAAMVPAWGYASRRMKDTLQTSRIPSLAMGSVFSLAAMMFFLPLPGGTTGHVSGTTVLAILLGPWAAVLAVSVSLLIQAVVMGDGGITAIGANCFNVALVGSLAGYGAYRVILRVAAWFVRTETGEAREDGPPLSARLVAGGVAAYLAINLGAFFAAVELGLQPWIYRDQTGAAYFPFPLEVAIPAVMLPHLLAVGMLEASVTVLVLFFFHRVEGSLKAFGKACVVLMIGASALLPASAWGHEYWIEKKGDGYAVIYGHGDKRLEYDPADVKKIIVMDAEGKPVPFRRQVQGKVLLVRPERQASLIVADLDSGYWSKTIYGWKNLPRRKASRVVEANRQLHYSKSLVAYGEAATRPVEGMRLDIVPLKNPLEMKAGEALQVRVVFDGRPAPGADIESEHGKTAETDREGLAKIALKKGRQLLTASIKVPLKDDPDADFLAVTTTLAFEVTK